LNPLERVTTASAARNPANITVTDESQSPSFMILERVLVLKKALA